MLQQSFKSRGRKKYPAAMCPECKHCDTAKKGQRYICNQCHISFAVNADGTTSYNKKIGEAMRMQAKSVESLDAVRLVLKEMGLLDGSTVPTRDYAKRPHCGKCGEPVTGRSFYHRSTGDTLEVICGQCAKGKIVTRLFQ